MLGPVARTGTHEPVLVLGSCYHSPEGDPSWAQAFPGLTSRQWLCPPDAGHYAFEDVGAAGDRWGLRSRVDPATWSMIFGDGGTERRQRRTIDLTAAFVRRTLTGSDEPLLAGPSPAAAGVEFR